MQTGQFYLLKEPVPTAVEEQVSRALSLQHQVKQVVLYQGVSKGVIRISFREFVNDMARPAFTQDVSYDLNPDGTTTVAFKGLRIFVEKATSAQITYRVLKPF